MPAVQHGDRHQIQRPRLGLIIAGRVNRKPPRLRRAPGQSAIATGPINCLTDVLRVTSPPSVWPICFVHSHCFHAQLHGLDRAGLPGVGFKEVELAPIMALSPFCRGVTVISCSSVPRWTVSRTVYPRAPDGRDQPSSRHVRFSSTSMMTSPVSAPPLRPAAPAGRHRMHDGLDAGSRLIALARRNHGELAGRPFLRSRA